MEAEVVWVKAVCGGAMEGDVTGRRSQALLPGCAPGWGVAAGGRPEPALLTTPSYQGHWVPGEVVRRLHEP